MFVLPMCIGAQDYPQFSQYSNLQGLVNPAYNGSREAYSALVVTRNQARGSITSHALNIHAPLPLEAFGAGLVVIKDNVGLFSNWRSLAALSYRIQVSKKAIFSVGFQGGFVREQVSRAFNNASSGGDIILDQYFGLTTNRVSAGLGLFLYGSRFYAGLALPEVLPDGFEFNDAFYHNIPLFMYGGVIFAVNADVSIKPTLFVQATTSAPMMIETGLYAYYYGLFSVGVSARTYPLSSLVFALEVKAVDHIYIGYSYDLLLEAGPEIRHSAHELTLRFDISAKDLFTRPTGSMRYF